MGLLLELDQVSYAYAEGIPALSGISLAVAEGERVAILGANGCGKTTLLKLLGGLVFAQQGAYRAFGRVITDPLLSRDPFGMFFRKEVGVLFQHVDAQLFNPTVEEEIAFGPLQLDDPPEEVRRKVRETMELFSLGPLAERLPFALSGGEKKKVALAAILATDPQVLLLDEPTAGLDPKSSRILIDLILEAQARGKTVVTSTNDLHVVPEIAGRVLVLGEDRRVLASGTPEAILQDRGVLRAANLIHRHRHAHEGYWHEHEHEHPGVFHVHPHDASSGEPAT